MSFAELADELTLEPITASNDAAAAVVHAVRPHRAAAFDRVARGVPTPATPAGPRGPGWFDSSHELASGLEVREEWPADAPLDFWLEATCRQAARLVLVE